MNMRKSTLLAATASVALLAIPPTGAFAFDIVDWEWQKLVHEDVNIDIEIIETFETDGMVQVEKLQWFFGDLEASAAVHDIENNPPIDGAADGTVVVIDELFNFDTTTDDQTDPSTVNPVVGTGGVELSAELVDGTLDEGSDNLIFNIAVTGEIGIDAVDIDAFDAADLPKIENTASAVANIQSIDSDVPLYLHDAQIAAGDINALDGEGGDPNALAFLVGGFLVTLLDDQLDGINLYTDLAALTVIGAATGFVEPANISATAHVHDILNAFVENSATAGGNTASWSLLTDEPAGPTNNNHVVIADMTQLFIGDAEAHAGVWNVDITNYGGFGAACFGGGCDEITPIISNSATAFGNNLTIKVGVPELDG